MNTLEIYIDNLLASSVHLSTSSLMVRLSANNCEHCGKNDSYLVMHHVRKMKDVEKGKQHSHSFYREGFRTVDITKMKTQENNIDNLLASRVHMSTTYP
ncbi:hypothetical protein ACIKK6_30205 [Bacillus thuringiensis]|uniref:HNH endonuclease n=1 Tax=Bacillus thuringiensis TaxID=1428 RepID=UPI0037CE6F75